MNKIKNTKGFTLMEMLIVVAIIAVLVAIAIPTFTTSLNKARVATDEANIRSGYASVMADVLTTQFKAEEKDKTAVVTYFLNKDGSVTAGQATDAYECFGKQDATVKIAGLEVTKWEKGSTVKYEYRHTPGANEKPVTITIVAPTQTGTP